MKFDSGIIWLLPWPWYSLWAMLIPTILTIIPPKPYRRFVAFIILYPILIKAQFFYEIDTSYEISAMCCFVQGLATAAFFYTFTLFSLAEYPEFTDYRPGIETLGYVRGLKPCTLEKFKWAFYRSFLGTFTGFGWNWEITNANKPEKSITRNKWIKNVLFKKFILARFLYQIFSNFYALSDYYESHGWGEGHTKDLVVLSNESSFSLFKHLLLFLSFAYCIFFILDSLYIYYVAIHVFIFGISDVNEHPELFGTFNGSYTVQSVWRNLWHKLLYYCVVPFSKFLVGCDYKAAHLNKKPRFGTEFWRTQLLYLVVFMMIGLIHVAATLYLPWENGARYNINTPQFIIDNFPTIFSRCFYSFVFFPYQYLLMIIERFIINLWKKNVGIQLPQFVSMIVGLAWIVVAEICLAQLYLDELVKGGLVAPPEITHFSLLGSIARHYNIKF